MTLTVQCFILLAFALMCASQVTQVYSPVPVATGCRCVTTSRTVTVSRIADLKIYEPRPHCKKKEIIVTLRGDEGLTEMCLNPKTRFAQAVVQTFLIQMERRAAQENKDKQNRAYK